MTSAGKARCTLFKMLKDTAENSQILHQAPVFVFPIHGRSRLDSWGGAIILFMYSGSAQLTPFESIVFHGV